MTKPLTAAAALVLVEECRIRLDDPVDEFLPELADRRVLSRPDGPVDDTVPAVRAVTLRDLLTFRLGLGMDFAATGPQTAMQVMVEQGIEVGPPAPGRGLPPDEWMRRLGAVPLERQPGERWLYHTSAEVLSVLIARVAGQPLPDFLRERIFEPLGMGDTAFSVSAGDLERFGPVYWTDPETGTRTEYDPPDGQWSAPPLFPNGADGLVSTVDDYLAFAEMLLGGGEARGARILSAPTVRAMTNDQLTDEQRRTGPDPTGATGWGFGVGVCVQGVNPARGVGCYGWDGGHGEHVVERPRRGPRRHPAHEPGVLGTDAAGGGHRLLDRDVRRDRRLTAQRASRIARSFSRSSVVARRAFPTMNGATSFEKPVGSAWIRSVMRVPPSTASHV